jgi:very-short-patch-repair endonuclease
MITTVLRFLNHTESRPEHRLWCYCKPLAPRALKTQVKVRPYRLDLALPRVKLAIEVDGPHHLDMEQAVHDANRTKFLKRQGWTVVRFTVREIELSPVTCALHVAGMARRLKKCKSIK